jgi:PAS domain S-box-containing protein
MRPISMKIWSTAGQPLNRRPIQQQITTVTLLTSGIVLLLACGALFAFQAATIKRDFAHQLGLAGEIVARNSAAGGAFGDETVAMRTLSGLKAVPQITSATLYAKDGRPLAHFGTDASLGIRPASGAPARVWIEGHRALTTQPILQDGQVAGNLAFQADFSPVYADLFTLNGGVFALVLAVSLLLAHLLSTRLQRFIAEPILQLASTAQRIARDKDYALRADAAGGQELGVLTDAFNQMLAQIQLKDGALQKVQEELKRQVRTHHHEIVERKRAEAVQARLTAILDATPDFVSSSTMTGRMLYMNGAARRMTGLSENADISQMKTSDFHPGWAARIVSTEGIPGAIHAGSWAGETALLHRDGREIFVSQVIIAHKHPNGALEYFSTVIRDITASRQAEEALRISQQKLLETSRLAGMAEVATGVLHNVGNVLNSLNVSACLVLEKLRHSKVANLGKAAALLIERNGNVAEYLTQDPNGQKLPKYLANLGEHLLSENAELQQEVDQLDRNIEHIKEIVSMQQNYAKVSGVFENLAPDLLVEDAIAMNLGAFERHGVVAERHYQPVPLVRVDRHKVLQILINLLRNAKYALDEMDRSDRRIVITIAPETEDKVRIVIADNGIGISPENLTKIFAHGFTTREDGHGFGLHSGALAAREMGGTLTAASAGHGCGATFTLELPADPGVSET